MHRKVESYIRSAQTSTFYRVYSDIETIFFKIWIVFVELWRKHQELKIRGDFILRRELAMLSIKWENIKIEVTKQLGMYFTFHSNPCLVE